MKKLMKGLKRIFSRRGEGGYVLTWVLILSVVAGFVLAPFLTFMLTGARASYSYADSMAEFYAADSGIEDGIYKISTDYSASTTLSGDIDDNDLEIPVSSTAGFPERGVIIIGEEYIKYTGKTDTSFIIDTAAGGERGYDIPINGDDEVTGDNDDDYTDPADHDSGAVVKAELPDNLVSGSVWEYGIEDINGDVVDVSIETIWTLWGLEDSAYEHLPPHNDMSVVGQALSTTSTRLLDDITDSANLDGQYSDQIMVSSTLSFPEAIESDPSVIRIDDELFQYTGTAYSDNGTTGDESDDFYLFTGVTRGHDETDWEEHTAGTAVTSEEKTYKITGVWYDYETAAMPNVDKIGCWLPPNFSYIPGTGNIGSELSSLISDSTGDIEVEDTSMFFIDPDVGYGVIAIEHELIKYEQINSGLNELQDCTRGYAGTEAASHSGGTPVTAEPNQKPHHGGTALEWWVNGYFDDLPREAPLMEGATMPDEYPLSRVITFSFSPAGQPNGTFAWILFQSNDIALSWDTSGGTYKVTSTATDPETGTHTTLESYVGAKKLTDRNAIVQGDARVIGNSLMLDMETWGDDAHIKDTILDESSANIGSSFGNAIPDGANIEAAYLYWSAYKAQPENISSEDLSDLAAEVNQAVFTVPGGDPNPITADNTQILQSYIYTYYPDGSPATWSYYGWVFSCFKDVTDLLDVDRDTYANITLEPDAVFETQTATVTNTSSFDTARVRITLNDAPVGGSIIVTYETTVWTPQGPVTTTHTVTIEEGSENEQEFDIPRSSDLTITSGSVSGNYNITVRNNRNPVVRIDLPDGSYRNLSRNQSTSFTLTSTASLNPPTDVTITAVSTPATVNIAVTTLPEDGYIDIYHSTTYIDTLDEYTPDIERTLLTGTPDTLTCGTAETYGLYVTCTDGTVRIDYGTESYIIGESNTQTNGEYTFGLDDDNRFVVDTYGGGWEDTGDAGEAGSFAGWSLIIIYSHPDEDSHQLFLYDDLISLTNYADNIRDENNNIIGYLEATISGFVAPEDFDGYLTYFVGEGDSQYGAHQYYIPGTGRTYADDEEYISLNGENLIDPPVNPEWNIMNSQSSVPGIIGSTDIGVDIDTYDLSGILEAGDSAATLKMDTGVDGWTLVFLFLSFKTEPTDDTGTTPIAVNTFSFAGQ